MKGVVSEISTPCPALLSKFAAALPLIPVNVGTQAAAVVATFEKLDNVPQAIFPFESVTAGAANTLAVEYTQNPVGEFLVECELVRIFICLEVPTLSPLQSPLALIRPVSLSFGESHKQDLCREKQDSRSPRPLS